MVITLCSQYLIHNDKYKRKKTFLASLTTEVIIVVKLYIMLQALTQIIKKQQSKSK